MKLSSVPGNSLKLDGGAMFGNVPRVLWERWTSPDELNRIQLASRCLLVRTEAHTLLFDAGTGVYMSSEYRERYGIQEPEHILLKSLEKVGLSHKDITDIVLSHLHFDHAGGLLSAWQEGKNPELLFPNASYYVSEQAWERATHPTYRDRASFVPLLNQQLKQSQRLVQLKNSDVLSFDNLEVHFFQSNGHTPGMLCSDVRWNEERLVFAADLVPGRRWVYLPITTGYDRFPELVINEKENLLTSLSKQNAWLFYTHDPDIAVSKVQFKDVKKTFIAIESYSDLEIFNR
jgi:glyoxylase-like metal-dependent hydrolase (beta-lactamase superfamily II)